jgi:2-polyprenyl-3-methyl-5-hydroxy-6-metoxy-1,4-benzoquinol methylase
MNERDLARWFDNTRRVLEDAYISHEEPWRQSGMSGPEDRWTALRRPVADCIDRPGTLLDIGCANGYFLECCVRWAAERGIAVEPYGLDISEKLVALARRRLPHWADRFFVGNAYAWQPPRRFDFVRTELVYVPAEHEAEYVRRLLAESLAPGGKLIVPNYAEDHPDPARTVLPGSYAARNLLPRLAELGFEPIEVRDGCEPVKGRRVRVAVLKAT